jgi:hypothetical protein
VSGIEDDADLLNTLGYLYAEHGAHLDRAVGLVRRASQLAPADTPETVRGLLPRLPRLGALPPGKGRLGAGRARSCQPHGAGDDGDPRPPGRVR